MPAKLNSLSLHHLPATRWIMRSLVAAAIALVSLFLFSKPAPRAATAATTAPSPAPSQHWLPAQKVFLGEDTRQVIVSNLDGKAGDDLVVVRCSPPRYSFIDGEWKTTFHGTNPTISIHIAKDEDYDLDQYPQYEVSEIKLVTDEMIKDSIEERKKIDPDTAYWDYNTTATVDDINGDGKPDILVAVAGLRQVIVLWNLGGRFEYVADNSSRHKSFSYDSPVAKYGKPLYCQSLDVTKDGNKDIVCYNFQFSSKGGVNHQYESLTVMAGYPPLLAGGSYWFNPVEQTTFYPGSDLHLGQGVDKDGMAAGTKIFRPQEVATFDSYDYYYAASDAVTGAYGLSNGSARLQVCQGCLADGGNSFLLEGEKVVREFSYDTDTHLVKLERVYPATTGQTRSAGSDLLNLGAKPYLVTAGGKLIYQIGSTRPVVESAAREYFDQKHQLGAYVKVLNFSDGTQLLATASSYQRLGDAQKADEISWGAINNGEFWGYDYLLLLEKISTESRPDATLQPGPVLQSSDRDQIQALRLSSGWAKPSVDVIKIGKSGEEAIAVLQGAKGEYLELYRRNDGSHTAALLKPEGVIPLSNHLVGMNETGEVSFAGEPAIVVGDFGNINIIGRRDDGPRHAIVKQGGVVKRILPVSRLEKPKDKDQITIEGMKELPVGDYRVQLWNSNQHSDEFTISIKKPFQVLGTNRDARIGSVCGIVPSTLAGKVYPGEFRVKVSDFPSAELEKVRLVRLGDGKQRDISAGPSSVRYEADEVVIPLPGDLEAGEWRMQIRAAGYWRPVAGSWRMNRDEAVCSSLVKPVNNIINTQCNENELYLGKIVAGPTTYNAGQIEFLGSGFDTNKVQTVVLKQGDKRLWSSSLSLGVNEYKDRILNVDFGDLEGKLEESKAVDVEFYPEPKTEVEAKGVPPIGKITSWRTARKGLCTSFPKADITKISPETIEPGKTVTITAKGVVHPGPKVIRLVATGADGKHYDFQSRLSYTEQWFTEKLTNSSTVTLNFTMPAADELDRYKVSLTSRISAREGERGKESSGAVASFAGPLTYPAPPIVTVPAPGVATPLAFALEAPTVLVVAGAAVLGWKLGQMIVSYFDKRAPGSPPSPPEETSPLWLVKYIPFLRYGEAYTASDDGFGLVAIPFRALKGKEMPKAVEEVAARTGVRRELINFYNGGFLPIPPGTQVLITSVIPIANPATVKHKLIFASALGMIWGYPTNLTIVLDGNDLALRSAEERVKTLWEFITTVSVTLVRVADKSVLVPVETKPKVYRTTDWPSASP